MCISKGFQWSTLYCQTNRKTEAMFRPRFSVWCFAKAFDCLSHELSAVRLIFDNRTNKKTAN